LIWRKTKSGFKQHQVRFSTQRMVSRSLKSKVHLYVYEVHIILTEIASANCCRGDFLICCVRR
jgi:hypothetical protein